MSSLIPVSVVAATILAGGQSTRMGQHKALLDYRGQPLIEHLIAQLNPQVGQVFVAGCPQSELYRTLSVAVINDAVKDAGPLGGISSAMQYLVNKNAESDSRFSHLLVLPCDGMALPPEFVARMINALESGSHELVYAKDSVRLQPLYALLSIALLGDLQGYLSAGGRKVIDWVERHDYAVVDFSDDHFCFANLNTPHDWHNAQTLRE